MHDEPYAAAFITKTIMEANGLVQAYSYWTFSDIVEENYFPSVPFQGGFGLLNIHGIAKPLYRAFQILHGLGAELLDVDGDHPTVDAWVIAKEKSATILLTNLAIPRPRIRTEFVRLRLSGAPPPASAWIERIDEDHANPRALWHIMGEPGYLSALQVEQLNRASLLRKQPHPWTREKENLEFEVDLPPQSVAAITFEFE